MFRLPHFLFFFLLLFFLTLLVSCRDQSGSVALTPGMHITQSITIKKDTFILDPQGTDSSALTISGDNLIIDFNGAVLLSAANPQAPNLFWGTGIRVLKGKNIQLKNVAVHGFKTGLLATDCDSLQLFDSDFSYNFRPHLPNSSSPKSNREKEEQLSRTEKQMAQPQKRPQEYGTAGAGVYLQNCDQARVKNVHVTGGLHGLVLANCQRGIFYNNTIQYNAGNGIGLYHSSHHWVMHNRLDWHSAAGIFAYGPCNDNVFAYNSATHSGSGIFLQATTSNVKSTTGNNNLIFGNDFSFAANHGIALQAGTNNIVYNRLENSAYGIRTWDSHHSLFLGNTFWKNNQALAINEDSTNLIRDNIFEQSDSNLGPLVAEYAPAPLADAQSTLLPEGSPRGRQYVLITEWGPYDFRYPTLQLRSIEGDTYTFVILGPQGNWQLVGGTGIKQISRKRGAVPATVVVQGTAGLSVEMKFIGAAAKTVFGEPVKKGKGILFGWQQPLH